ncbi:MAG TPA: T9SS type A sorting domain-containing protein [Ignavibacteriaceae bacterium]|nr:T9SS type A sorting domain-containing protein [Ignavibacteriaceae bacterium]
MKAKKCVLFILLLFLINSQASFTQNQISLNIIGSGGERSSNTDFVLNSSTGEVFTGKSLNASNHQYSGFWYIYSNSITTSIESDEVITPDNFKLEQNYPNPFNPSTIIKFAIAEKSKVVIQIYDITGSKVITLVNEEMDAGWYQREFNAAGLSSGIYLVRLQADNFVNTKKMLMVK